MPKTPAADVSSRAKGILQDIDQLRDSPLLQVPFLRLPQDSDRWLLVWEHEMMAIGACYNYYPSLASAAPAIIAHTGKVIGLWNLLGGDAYGELRMPKVYLQVDFPPLKITHVGPANAAPVVLDEEVLAEKSIQRATDYVQGLGERTFWHGDPKEIKRYLVLIRSENDRDHYLASFHDDIFDVAMRVCDSPDNVVDIRDFGSRYWRQKLPLKIAAKVDLDGTKSSFSWDSKEKMRCR